MIAAASSGALTLDKLEAMTCVCSVGLDMIAVPGNTSAETLSAIIADEAAIGMVNSKTTAVRLIPAPWQAGGRPGGVRRPAGLRPGAAGPSLLRPGLCGPGGTHSRPHAESEKLSGASAFRHDFKQRKGMSLPLLRYERFSTS